MHLLHGRADGQGSLAADAEEDVAVGAGAGAAAAGLDAKKVVEQARDEVAVQVLSARFRRSRDAPWVQQEGDDGLAVAACVATQHLQARVLRQAPHCSSGQCLLPPADEPVSHVRLHGEGQGGPNLLHDGRRSGVLPLLQVLAVERLLEQPSKPDTRQSPFLKREYFELLDRIEW